MENNQPEVRFPEFSESWNKVKLGNVFEQTTEYVNPKTRNIELWSLTVEKGLTPKTDRYNREFLVKKEDQFKAVSSNEFIYNPMNMTLGAVDLNQTGKQVAVSGYYITMKTLNGFDNDYFNIWLKSPLAIKMYKSYATGSLIEKQRVQFPTLSLIKASVPPMEEQRKIGNFFKQLDDTITLHQQELSTLKQTKQGFLQKMFPREGESVPEVRFPGFDGEWEQRKLGEMMDVTSVKRIHQSDWTDRGVRFLRARDIVAISKNEEPSDYLYISVDKYNEYSKVSGKVAQGDLLVTGVGSIGVPMLISGDDPIYFKDGNIIWFKNNQTIQGDFFYYSFINSKIQKYIRDVAGIGTVGTYTIDSGKKTPISLPNFEEQTMIGEFFKRIDDTIALHQRELVALKETKKAFLQKMFVK
ncbi:restriction endonuclease subunit S [Rossellomorea aquimaris]|uniref:restriction endonuclease subunit S n=1 Tax=Rossellomorea aquimaris TaxID=189382 RepID=UPI0011E8F714|nr:restriction endonuclease subunit S [Rossellomorea aquimaris]TYS89961.1 restriction endonuclease subunit S [Rossellomorea aquimaris]